jgi:ABC-type multidrug transport system permease subunit
MASMFSIGIMVGGIAKNTKVAGIIASILYFPMLIFSGATLPYEVMPKTLQSIVDFPTLTQGIKILNLPSWAYPWIISLASLRNGRNCTNLFICGNKIFLNGNNKA